MKEVKAKASKRRKAIGISCIAVASLLVAYLGGGTIAGLCAFSSLFDHRLSTAATLEEEPCAIFKTRNDYPNLAVREEYQFKSGENMLKGYLYETSDPKGIFISTHGMKGLSDDATACYQSFLLEQGYDVFAIDLTAHGNSDGSGLNSLHQSALDILAAEDYISNLSKVSTLKVGLIGYSCGAYGSLISLQKNSSPFCVISFSSFNDEMTYMVDVASSKSANIAYATYPCFYISSSIRFGSVKWQDASSSVLNASDTKVFLAQGDLDATVPYFTSAYASLFSNFNDRIKGYLLEGVGHQYPWFSKDSLEYAYDSLLSLSCLSNEERKAAVSNVDKEKTSQINSGLFDAISSFLA